MNARILEVLDRTLLTVNSSRVMVDPPTLTVAHPPWTPNWPGGQRCSLEEERAAA